MRFVVCIISATLFLPSFCRAYERTIWTVGDSITWGENDPDGGGYRDDLLIRTNARGWNDVRFVGTSTQNATPAQTAAGQDRHNGNRGWKISQVAFNMDHDQCWFYNPDGSPATVPDTDFILLMIGTNDMIQDNDLPNAPARLQLAVDKIVNYRPNARLLLATIPPLWYTNPNDPDDKIVRYNAEVAEIALAARLNGNRVTFVDQFRNFVNPQGQIIPGTLPDLIHPSAGAYAAMARTWFDAMMRPDSNVPYLVPEPSSAAAFMLLFTLLTRRR